jgi:hypothetical protein
MCRGRAAVGVEVELAADDLDRGREVAFGMLPPGIFFASLASLFSRSFFSLASRSRALAASFSLSFISLASRSLRAFSSLSSFDGKKNDERRFSSFARAAVFWGESAGKGAEKGEFEVAAEIGVLEIRPSIEERVGCASAGCW